MITQAEYAKRREAFFEQMQPNSVAIIPTAPEYLRSADQYHDFYPDPSFYYLTGFEEPCAICVLVKEKDGKQKYILFNRRRDLEKEQWVGFRAGQKGAKEIYGADESYPYRDFTKQLTGLLVGYDVLYYTLGRSRSNGMKVEQALKEIRSKVRLGYKAPDMIINAENVVFEMRVFKSETEIDLMKKAAKISANAHKKVMTHCKPGMNEYELEAELTYEFRRHGCQGQAYASIVGGGKNACILHYIENKETLKDGDLVLIDAGGSYQHYSADITRTFPVNGKFTEDQKAIYNVVLKAADAAIAEVKPGNPWHVMSDVALRILVEGLVELGILKGDVDELIEKEAYKPFYMHRIGHWLGIDVHDVGDYKKDGEWRSLEPGMVTTIEPGLYILPGMEGVDERWWGIGVRVEDDVLVTKDGHEILSTGAPRTIEEIEAVMQTEYVSA